MKIDDKLKLFAYSHQIVERELDRIEDQFSIDLGRDSLLLEDKDEIYYPQFDESIRQEAASMAAHYELFYSLETSIRVLLKEKLEAEAGANWWEDKVPDPVKDNAQANIQKEIDSGVTLRSTEEIDYTTFGELGVIVRKNWETFSDTFNSLKAFNKIMTSLNILRGPIAHCSPLAENEVVRLQLTLGDWFRLME